MSDEIVLVTGATGLIGNAIAKRLRADGRRVRALVRDPSRARDIVGEGVELVKGDITDPPSVADALRGASLVFHAAGMPEQWHADDTIFDRVNRAGTVNVLEGALAAKVRRVVYTSTMDVFAAPRGGTLVETNLDAEDKPTAYERSKQAAEREAERIRSRGLDVVYLNPSAVFGPSPVHVALNDFFLQILNRKAPLLPPGGMSVLYVDGCTDAHIAAAERGVNGERYLLSDGHVTNADLARRILAAAGTGKAPPPNAPAWLIRALAGASAPLARTFGFKPIIAPGQLSFLMWNVRVDAGKARRELGFEPTPLDDGVAKTVAFLRAAKLAP